MSTTTPTRYLISNGHTWQFDADVRGIAPLAGVILHDELLGGGTNDLDMDDRWCDMPTELRHRVQDDLVMCAIACRDFGAAMRYVCMDVFTVGRWYTRLVTKTHLSGVPVLHMVRSLTRYFALLNGINESFDSPASHFVSVVDDDAGTLRVEPRKNPSRIPILAASHVACLASHGRIGAPFGGPEEFVHTGESQKTGRIMHSVDIFRESVYDALLMIHQGTDDKGQDRFLNPLQTWRGERVCDSMLHEGAWSPSGILESNTTVFPYMLLDLRSTEAVSCYCDGILEVAQANAWKTWTCEAARWETFARLVELAFGGAKLFVAAPWSVFGVSESDRPSLVSHVFAEPKNIPRGKLVHE